MKRVLLFISLSLLVVNFSFGQTERPICTTYPPCKLNVQSSDASLSGFYGSKYFSNTDSSVKSQLQLTENAKIFLHKQASIIESAIKSLKEDRGIIDVYILPMLMGLFSALIGAVVAFGVFIRQEKLRSQESNPKSANQFMVYANQALGNLLSIKEIYHGRLTEGLHPIVRALKVPPIRNLLREIDCDISSLNFIFRSVDSCPAAQPFAIMTMFENYNLAVVNWERHSELRGHIQQCLVSDNEDKLHADDIEKVVPKNVLHSYIHLTESLLKLTDDLIIELSGFIYTFPDVAEHAIAPEVLDIYGGVIRVAANENEKVRIDFLMKRVPQPDLNWIAKNFGG